MKSSPSLSFCVRTIGKTKEMVFRHFAQSDGGKEGREEGGKSEELKEEVSI